MQSLLITKEILIVSNAKTMCKEHNLIPVTKLERAPRKKLKS